MNCYAAFCDDFYVNMILNTEMDLPQSREPVLHFFEQVQKRYPTLENFFARERGEYALEEEKDNGAYRWVATEAKRITSGQVNPPSIEAAMKLHEHILEIAPYALSLSHLDCESLSVMFGFDFTFRGNHNQLLVDALGMIPAFEKMADFPKATLLSHEPSLQLALDDDCRTQCRISFEPRTSAMHIRADEYPEEQLSVYLTVRRYDSLRRDESFIAEIHRLAKHCQELADGFLVEHVLKPLQQTIASK